MSEQQPEYVWAFPPEKRRGGRSWLIGVLVVAAVVLAGAVALMLIRPWNDAPAPAVTSSVTPMPTPTASESLTPTPIPTPTSTPTPLPTAPLPPPTTAAPPTPADPELGVFRGNVQPLLDDAARGLSFAGDSTGAEGVQLVDQLQGDAGRMSDAVAPRSIANEWADRVSAYGAALDKLRAAFETGTSTGSPLAAAESAQKRLQQLLDR
ncbi:hypothetical protein [Microbacterium esteraromaticum]|uniref:hypothetical protein n=1 Tax=Microbacterium esteraromaticum TaxID=57043 RepID=UPI001C95487A|nr:hypothetical protein [Microbacterium esteraromaticum]MBY6060678.1 hypothetical protein [Microbacterium esteraromaticum]